MKHEGTEIQEGDLVKIELRGLVSPDWLVVKESHGGLYASPDPTHPRWISEVTITDHGIPEVYVHEADAVDDFAPNGFRRTRAGEPWLLVVGVDPADFSTPVEVEPEYVTVAGNLLLSSVLLAWPDFDMTGDHYELHNVLTAEASARILADPSWEPVTREIKVGDRVRDEGGYLGVVIESTIAGYTRIKWDQVGFAGHYHPSQFSLVAKEDAAYTPPAPPKPSWHGPRVVISEDGTAWVACDGYWSDPAYAATEETVPLERKYGPIRTLVDRDGRVHCDCKQPPAKDAYPIPGEDFPA